LTLTPRCSKVQQNLREERIAVAEPNVTGSKTARLDTLMGLTGKARASLSDHAGLLKTRSKALAASVAEFGRPARARAALVAASVLEVAPEKPAPKTMQ
jgi:hypothetical protein